MCEFCIKHGEGKKWYLNVNNYATELLNDLERKSFIKHFYEEIIRKGNKDVTRLEKMYLRNKKLIERIAPGYIEQMKSTHFGQVVPLEDVLEIFSLANTIVRFPCGCRWEVERKEKRYCFGISSGPPHWYDDVDLEYFGTPDMAQLEYLSIDEVEEVIKELDKQGLVHSVWTFKTPFIGAVCNCDNKSYLAMRTKVGIQLQTMFRAESVTEIDLEKCKGCKACIDSCQFEAIDFSEDKKICLINYNKCFGCGVCRTCCPENAISLVDRNIHSVVSNTW